MNESILQMKSINKSFYGNPVLSDVNLDVRKGEVHVLLGENGAGKSTLMKILSGSYALDAGQIFLNGENVIIKDPAHSQRLGIGMVYQELSLVPHMSVLENIKLGNFPTNRIGFVNWSQAKKEALHLLEELGLNIDIMKPVSNFDLGIQQLVEIIRVISQDAKIIILDEPTSSLTDTEVEMLFSSIGKLRADGISFIYITHKLDEVFRIGDRITVLRDGSTIGDTIENVANTTHDELVSKMVGRTLSEQYPRMRTAQDVTIFEAVQISDGKRFFDVSFSVKKGEVFGIAGLVGSGRTDLANAIYGLSKLTHGEIFFNGMKFAPKNPADSIKHGIGLITKDRRDGLLLHMPIYTNICVTSDEQFSRLGFRNKKHEIHETNKFINLLRIDTNSPVKKVRDLSGGNQQKVAIAKWNCADSLLYIMDDPTRGVDVGAKVEVYNLINNITSNGASVILISSDLPELFNIADRVMVMRKGRVATIMNIEDCSQEMIIEYAAGGA